MKKIFLVSLLFITFFVNSEDLTSDNLVKTNPMKFRGSIFMGIVFYPGHHENFADNHYSSFNTEKKDYTDVGDPTFKHHENGDPGRVWGAGAFATHGIEGKLFANFSMIAPFLAFDHFLLKDNSIAMTFKFGISPVSTSFGTELTITPIPFLVFSSGFMISFGYNIPIAVGFARNNYSGMISGENKSLLIQDSLYGPVFSNWFNATFQFDVAALMPASYKRWSHIVMRAKGEMFHRMVPNLDSNTPYVYENDNGENYNGWYLYFDSMIGYKIPIIEDEKYEKLKDKMFIGSVSHNNFSLILGCMANIDEYNITRNQYSPMASKGWGSDFMTVVFGPMAFFELPNNLYAILVFNWQNGRVYSDATVGNADFTKREYEDWYVYYKKIALVFGWNF